MFTPWLTAIRHPREVLVTDMVEKFALPLDGGSTSEGHVKLFRIYGRFETYFDTASSRIVRQVRPPMAVPEPARRRRTFLKTSAAVAAFSTAGCLGLPGSSSTDDDSPTDDSSTSNGVDEVEGVEIETVVDGLDHPWGLSFVPATSKLLVTERGGRLTLVDTADGSLETVDGTPDVHAAGQGGLLDVTIHPEFDDEPWVYLTYSALNDDGDSTTHLGRGRLDIDEPELESFEELHAAEPYVDSNGHYGSRVVFGEDGMVYMTTGDRQFKDFGPEHVSQDTTNDLGSTLRLAPDGSIPADNPFVDEAEASDALFSYGHRNPQGMTVHPETGDLWVSDHGEQDGDELEIVERGGNHGWPIAHYGCTYGDGDPIGDDPHERDDVVDPVYHWECNSGGFPPAGMTFYDGDAFDDWQGDLFVGNLAGQYLGHFTVDGRDVEETEPLLADRGWRIRDVAVESESGHLYVAVDDGDAPIVRLHPE